MNGKLIVFEGTDGSGKTTQTKLICQRLDREGIAYRESQFPGMEIRLQSRQSVIWKAIWEKLPER